jgi:hypothetical protein
MRKANSYEECDLRRIAESHERSLYISQLRLILPMMNLTDDESSSAQGHPMIRPTWWLRLGTSSAARLVLLLAFIAPPVLAQPYDYTVWYNADNTPAFVAINKYLGNASTVVIPRELDRVLVKAIGARAFAGCTNLVNIVIPETVNVIGASAFESCAGLKAILIPENVTSIAENTFKNCTSLRRVFLPGLTHIGSNAFDSCSSLEVLYIRGNAPILGSSAFANADKASIYYVTGTTGWDTTFGGRPTVPYIDLPYTFSITETNVTITGYTGSGVANIPETIFDIPVTGIANEAFAERVNLRSVTMPDSVTSLGLYAFGRCPNLTNITLSSGITKITNITFYGCTSLENIVIPSSVTELGFNVFSECSSLKFICFDGDAPPIQGSSLGDNLRTNLLLVCHRAGATGWDQTYAGFRTALWEPGLTFCYNIIEGGVLAGAVIGAPTEVNIPESINGLPVTSIQENAFYECASLNYVSIPNTVTRIGDSAYERCTNLASVTLGSGLTNIGDYAFCVTGLTNIVIPESVTSIGSFALAGCTKLTTVNIPSQLTTLGWGALNSDKLSSITVDALNPAFRSVGGVLFDKAGTRVIRYPEGKIGSYTIPEGVTSIGDAAFSYCQQLTHLTIPSTVTNIGHVTFQYCNALTSFVVPERVTSIGDFTFDYCTSLTNIVIADGVTSFGLYSFNHCWSLANLLLPNGLTNIADSAFDHCTSLSSISIPDSVITIGSSAFYSCTNIASVTIGKRVASVGWMAFRYCSSLTNVVVGDSVTTLENSAFGSCPKLSGIYFEGNAPILGGTSVFRDDTNAIVYYLPGTAGWGSTFGGRPTAQWVLPRPVILSNTTDFGVSTSGFGFVISWATNVPVVVEACTDLASPIWSPLSTARLTAGTVYFSDPNWSSHPTRMYRVRTQ